MSKKRKTSTNAPSPQNTVGAAEQKSKFEYIVVNIICLFCFLAFGYIAIMSFFQTSVLDPNAYVAEHILYENDSVALNLFFTALFVLVMFAMRRFYDFFAKINLNVLEIALGVYIALLGMIWIFSVTSMPAADSQNLFETASESARGDYSSLVDFSDFYNKDFYRGYSYYNFYPFQLGFVLLSEMVYRIFGSVSSMPMQVINVLACAAAYVGIARITRVLFERKSIEFISIFLLAGCLQPVIFCTFVYGNIIGMSLGIWACFFLIRYFQTEKYTMLIPCGVLLLISTIAKYNNLIYLVAFAIMIIIHMVKSFKKSKLLFIQGAAFVLASFIAVFGSSALIITSYETRAQTTFAGGLSQVQYLDLGVQESSRAPGWYSRIGLDTYLNNGFDSDAADRQSWQSIGNRLDEFSSDTGYALDFFGKKILSQWNEPTYESVWVSKVKGHEKDIKGTVAELVYDKSLGQFLELHFGFYMRILFVLFALGIYLMFINKKTNIKTVLLPLVIMGAFGYHLLFEAKSQYLATYIPLFIPVAAYAFNVILFGDYSPLKRVVEKINKPLSSR